MQIELLNPKSIKSSSQSKFALCRQYYDDETLMEAANLIEMKVQVLDIIRERLDTYVIKGAKDSGVICLNGLPPAKCKL